MTRENEDIRALLRRFYDAPEAQAVEEDLHWADEQMAAWPAPTPRPQATERIKGRVRRYVRHHHRQRSMTHALASVAAVAVVALVGYMIWRPDRVPVPAGPLGPASTWAIETDADLEHISAELDDIMNTMTELQIDVSGLGPKTPEPDSEAMDPGPIGSLDDFWKG